MRILRIRLRNVKSYGDPGIDVEFADGVNFLSGENGAGKSTLIESIGYALYNVGPCRVEDLVRRGARSGSVTVWIEDQGERFRVERKFGSSSSWVIYDRDDVALHEKQDDVVRFFCERFRVADAEQLRNVFEHIVGVAQGTYTAVFKLTPAQRRQIFDGITNVHLYRQKSDERADVRNKLIAKDIAELNTTIATARSYMAEHADDPTSLLEATNRLTSLEGEASELGKRVTDLTARKKILDQARTRLEELARKIERLDTTAQRNSLADAQADVERSRAAAESCRRAEPGHREFLEAEKSRSRVEVERQRRDKLAHEKGSLETQLEGQRSTIAAEEQNLKDRTEEEQSLLRKRKAREEEWAELDRRAAKSEEEAHAAARAREKAEEALESEREHLVVLTEAKGTLRGRHETIAKLEKSLVALEAAENSAQEAEAARTRALALNGELASCRSALEEQKRYRKQLSTRQCPFIQEKCDRVASAVFQKRIDELQADLGSLQKRITEADKAVAAGKAAEERLAKLHEKKDQLADVRRELDQTWKELRRKLRFLKMSETPDLVEFERIASERAVELARLEKEKKALSLAEKQAASRAEADRAKANRGELAEIEDRLKTLRQAMTDRGRKLERLRKEFVSGEKRRSEILSGLAKLGDIEGQHRKAVEMCDAHREAHLEFIRNHESALELAKREQRVRSLLQSIEKAEADRAKLEKEKSEIAFDANEASTVESDLEAARQKLAGIESDRRNLGETKTRLALAVEELRRREAAAASGTGELHRLQRFQRILDDVWGILRNLGARVSERLIAGISARANRIFGILQGRPGQLVWHKDYEVRLKTGDSDLPYSNLSGGERMSAALAIQMAMARDFAGSSFCIFDEPTIHLDEGRCGRLAQAIREAQKEAGFTQLFVVSHDDTFGPYVDHQVRLRRSPAGTVVEA